MFSVGSRHRYTADWKLFQSVARSTEICARYPAVPGSVPTNRITYARPAARSSFTIGPCSVNSSVTGLGASPLTGMVSGMTVTGFQAPLFQ